MSTPPNTYSDTPLASDIVANSQSVIRSDFTYLANTLGTSNMKEGDHQISIGGIDTTAFEGRHVQVCFNNRSPTGPTVAGIADGVNSLLYSLDGNIFFDSASLAGPFQITTVASTFNTSRFGTLNTVGNSSNAGWTFLPGGLVLQYGRIAPASSGSVAITFPVTFPTNVINIQLTIQQDSNNTSVRNTVSDGTVTTSGFTWVGSSTSHLIYVYWMAIGN